MTNRKSGAKRTGREEDFPYTEYLWILTATYTPIKPLSLSVGHVHRLDAGAARWPVMSTMDVAGVYTANFSTIGVKVD